MNISDFIPEVRADPLRGDYVENGILMCGKCKTPKQTWVDVGNLGGKRLFPAQCKCERTAAEEDTRKIESARTKMLLQDIVRLGYLDKSYLSETFEVDDGRTPKIAEDMKRYVSKWSEMKEKNIGLIFCGPCGRGKTFYAACIANAVRVQYHDRVLISSLPALVDEMSRNYGENSEAVIERLKTYPLVVIDDLGVERDTAFSYEKVENIINTRCRAEKPLVITTNLSMDDFKAPNDIRQQRIFSRLSEMCVPYTIDGPDRRRPKGQAKVKAAREILGF